MATEENGTIGVFCHISIRQEHMYTSGPLRFIPNMSTVTWLTFSLAVWIRHFLQGISDSYYGRMGFTVQNTILEQGLWGIQKVVSWAFEGLVLVPVRVAYHRVCLADYLKS